VITGCHHALASGPIVFVWDPAGAAPLQGPRPSSSRRAGGPGVAWNCPGSENSRDHGQGKKDQGYECWLCSSACSALHHPGDQRGVL